MMNKWLIRAISLATLVGILTTSLFFYSHTSVSATSGKVAVELGTNSYSNTELVKVEPFTTKIETNKYTINYSGEIVNIGKGTNTFVPEITMYRFGQECSLTLYEPTINGAVLSQKNAGTILTDNTISWASKDLQFLFYPKNISEQNNYGSFEYEIILANSKAGTDRILDNISFPITSNGLVFYYQPPLTQEYEAGYSVEFERNISVNETDVWDTDTGEILVHRPIDVVGSYAVYHATKSGHVIGKTNYMAGKAFHIYRPMLIDNAGDTAWADLIITDDTLSIDFSGIKNWLNKAKYPVVIDPDFGYTGHGLSYNAGASYIWVQGDTVAGAAGTGISMSIYAKRWIGDYNLQMAVYDNSSPLNLIANAYTGSVVIDNTTADWRSANFASAPTFAAVPYYLVFNQQGPSSIYYDTSTAGSRRISQAFGTWPSSIDPTDYGNYQWSIYCTYEAAAADPEIGVLPITYDFGTVAVSTTPYTATNYFTLSNNSTIQTDMTIAVTTANWTGGIDWIHSDNATAGANTAGLLANRGGTWETGDVIVKYTAPNFIYENCPASTNFTYGLKLLTPTSFSDGEEKVIIVRISAVAG